MEQYNDIDFNNLYFKYHPEDHTLRCENNIVYYNGETKFFAGRCGVQKGECVNLGYFRVGKIDIPVWRLEPEALFFLLREYVNSIYMVNNINRNLEIINSIVKKPNLGTNETETLSSFMDYYNSLKMFKLHLRAELKENFEAISEWISKLLSGIALYTPGYKLINEKFFEYAKANNEDIIVENNDGGKGVARTHHNNAYKTKPSTVPILHEATDYDVNFFSNGAFTTLLTIIFLIIATVAVVLTLIFL